MTKSMHFKLISESADGIGFAVRLRSAGHRVSCWIRSTDAKSVGDRLVDKRGDIDDLVRDSTDEDVFLFDVSGNGLIADALRERGFAVLGGSGLMDRLERDREYGYAVMKECKIDVPQTESFKSFADGIDFVESNPDVRWVYKPSKQLGDLSPSHVSYDTEDMVQLLTNIEQDVDISDPQFELQAFEKGVAMSTELWFQNGEFIAPLTNHTLERKELMNDDLGPSGGCLGNIVWLCDGCPLCNVAKRLIPWCERNRYHGMLDLNVIVAKDAVYGLEFTPRFGYDASPTFLWELVRGDLGSFFSDLAHGQLRDVDTVEDTFAGAVRVTIPPWPSEKYTAEENIPIRGLTTKDKDVYLYNVKADKDNELVSAGAWGILALLTHRAGTVNGAMRGPLERCKELKIKNKQFRTDLAERFNEDLAKLEVLNAVY
jgi:phosphoribosylamine-glycine ligase